MQENCTPSFEALDRLCRIANREAFAVFEIRNTCIITSAALRDALEAMGIPARLMRVETLVTHQQRDRHGVVLGFSGYGWRRHRSSPDQWKGHVAVVADGRFLLDPTLDQVEDMEPLTCPVPPAWLSGHSPLWS